MTVPTPQLPGRLPESWLDTDEPCDPWALEATDLHDPGRRDGFVGSGWLGQRIGPWGDGDFDLGSGSFLAGFRRGGSRGRLAQIDLPRWAILRHVRATPRSLRPVGETRDWRQVLDLRTATISTSYRWVGCEQEQSMDRRTWIARHEPLVGVLEATVDHHRGWSAEFVDELDARHLGPDAHEVQVGQGETMLLSAVLGPARRTLVLASRLVVEGDGADRAKVDGTGDGRLASRRLFIPLKPGQRVKVTKVVALATDADGDDPQAVALARLEAALTDLKGMRRDHEAAWAEQWRHHIGVPHARLQRLLNVSLYGLCSQLHPGHDHSVPPCGISGIGWDGHIFWDADLWVHGVLSLLDPRLGGCITRYRQRRLEAAKDLARRHGQAGARWPWMSADSGGEQCFEVEFQEERHVNACVAMAQWRQALAEGDPDAWSGPAGDCILASAEWFAGVLHRDAQGRWRLPPLCGSDEHGGIVPDNSMTAAAAAWTLRAAIRVGEHRHQPVPGVWAEMADHVFVPRDHARRLVLPHSAWKDGTVIKQADATLMIWPYEYPLDDEERAAIVDTYSACYPDGVIMMSHAIDGIVHASLGRGDRAWDCLRRMLPNFAGPFMLCTESATNETAIFTTGLGGLLHLVVHGFCGLRLREHGLEATPCMPEAVPWVEAHGLSWLGVERSLRFDKYGMRDASPSTGSGPDAEARIPLGRSHNPPSGGRQASAAGPDATARVPPRRSGVW